MAACSPGSSKKYAQELKVRVEGQTTVNNIALRLNSTLGGLGLACLPEDQAIAHDGRLIRVLGNWCPVFSGYHLYYRSRRHTSPEFALLVESLRYRFA